MQGSRKQWTWQSLPCLPSSKQANITLVELARRKSEQSSSSRCKSAIVAFKVVDLSPCPAILPPPVTLHRRTPRTPLTLRDQASPCGKKNPASICHQLCQRHPLKDISIAIGDLPAQVSTLCRAVLFGSAHDPLLPAFCHI